MSLFWLSNTYRYVSQSPGLLAIGGIVARPASGLSFDDLRAIDAEHQVSDVGAYARNLRISSPPIQGVRLAALMSTVDAHPEAILVNVTARNGFQGTVWRREIERLAIIAYARGNEPLPRDLGGPFRLVLPGFKDETRDVWDIALLEFSEKAGLEPKNRRGLSPAHPSEAGVVQGGLSRARIATSEPRTIVVPPPLD